MTKFLWSLIKTAPVVVGASFLAMQGASAATETVTEKLSFQSPETLVAQALTEGSTTDNSTQQMLRQRGQLNRMDGQLNENKSESMDQITSVSELRDVQPTEWAYEALRSLVERYGCIVGYPDGTYRGNRALSRWEFAAGLNACLNTIERLIQENVAVLKEDVDTLKRLAQEFEAELAALGGRVDNLEARVSFLEDHQFSTTTKLKGEVIFSVADTFGDFADGRDEDDPNVENGLVGNRTDDPTQTVFQNRVRLNFETSFTGEDLLRTRLQAGNFGRFNEAQTGTNMTRLAYDDGSNNDVTINDLWYRFPIGESLTVWAGPSGLDLDDVFSTVNPYLADSGVGSLSRYARYNNMVNRGPAGAGAGAKFEIGDKFYVSAAYLAEDDDAPDPSQGNGVFNGSFSTGGQVGFLPTEDIELAATYVYSYRTEGSGGLFGDISSQDAEFPFGEDIPTTAHRIGLSASWKITDIIHIGAYGGYGTADAQLAGDIDLGGADIWTWNANVSILDLGKEGAVLSLSGGLPPKGEYIIDGGDIRNGFRRVDDQSYIIQAQYKFPINDNIFITPGAYVVLNPNNDNSNDPLWVGVIRTTFKF
jgi:hypothetical protein